MIKIYIDRPSLSSEEINSRRDFNRILNQIPKKKVRLSPWFYGAVGLSSVFIAATLILLMK